MEYRDYVVTDEALFRPAEVNLLIGDASEARRTLGWEPECTFRDLVHEMVNADLAALSSAGLPALKAFAHWS